MIIVKGVINMIEEMILELERKIYDERMAFINTHLLDSEDELSTEDKIALYDLWLTKAKIVESKGRD
jgi:hypothetical protein